MTKEKTAMGRFFCKYFFTFFVLFYIKIGYNRYYKKKKQNFATFGCEKAYTLDGGQTAVIAMNDKLINQVSYGAQREISDIIYFATALPWEE